MRLVNKEEIFHLYFFLIRRTIRMSEGQRSVSPSLVYIVDNFDDV